MKVIYISSPYTIGDKVQNVKTQIDAAHRIMDLGHCPIAPNLSILLEVMRPRSYEDWMRVDLELVGRSDIVLRLPGESKGADRETARALKLNLPVAYGWDELDELLKQL